MKVKDRLRGHRVAISVMAIIGLMVLIPYVQLKREPPSIDLGQLSLPPADAAASAEAELSLPWPAKGNAAVGIGGVGIVQQHQDTQPKPIASLVKMMTAYVVMNDHPLKAGDPGPEVTAEAADVNIYRSQQANGESVIPVADGSVMMQRELLAGVLVPSGNNLAFLLARWSAGSLDAFVERMNQEAAALGMTSTHYVDPSGISPQNVSTATDQVRLAEALMRDPTLSGIVGLKQASLPVAGTVYNVNSILGQDSIVGVKTGWTEDAGGCFVLAADRQVDGQTVRVYAAAMGQDTLADAFAATRALLAAIGDNLHVTTIVSKEGPAVSMTTEWGAEAAALPDGEARVAVWPGLQVDTELQKSKTLGKSLKRGDEVGKVVITAGGHRQEIALKAQESMGRPGLLWRLTRPPSLPW